MLYINEIFKMSWVQTRREKYYPPLDVRSVIFQGLLDGNLAVNRAKTDPRQETLIVLIATYPQKPTVGWIRINNLG